MNPRHSKRVYAEGVYIVSLGCPKNLVDSEVMAGCLITSGIPVNMDKNSAEYYLINTCAFLPGARSECESAIADGIRWKKRAPQVRKLVVAGCLIQQDKENLIRSKYPEVDAWSGVDGVDKIFDTFSKAGSGYTAGDAAEPTYLYNENSPRILFTLPHVAYLKISDGCNNRCAYCSIPGIRGSLRSRSIESVLIEARNLIAGGVSEIIIIAQDVTAYGSDLADGTTLAKLLHEMDKLEGDFVIRLLYTHPAHYTEEFFAEYASNKHLLPYLDIPLQHISDDILLKMGRKTTRERIEYILNKIRSLRNDSTIRTTFITGLPGEGDKEFAELEEFVKTQKFSRLGVFSYSPEPGTPAAERTDRVSTEVAEERAGKIMQLQEKIALENNQAMIGKVITVICDEADGRNGVGRSFADAPEIDNLVYFSAKTRLQPGRKYQVRINRAKTFDLYGEVC